MNALPIKAAAATALMLLASTVVAGDCLPQVREGWVRLAPAGMAMPMLAGFARIENHCPKAVVVTTARSGAFGEVSLHRTSIVDGISRMRPVASLPIAANGAATLAPGGLHLMLMQPTSALKPGATLQIVFRLRDGREVRGDFVTRDAATP